jgi:hypothetical protein
VSQAGLYRDVPSRSLLQARLTSCRSCTPANPCRTSPMGRRGGRTLAEAILGRRGSSDADPERPLVRFVYGGGRYRHDKLGREGTRRPEVVSSIRVIGRGGRGVPRSNRRSGQRVAHRHGGTARRSRASCSAFPTTTPTAPRLTSSSSPKYGRLTKSTC